MNEKTIQMSPIAILAAVLYHAMDTVQVKVKPDDGAEEAEVSMPVIGVEVNREDDTVACRIPFALLMKYATTEYQMGMKLVSKEGSTDPNDQMVIVGFRKGVERPLIVDPKSLGPISTPALDKLFGSLNGRH